MALPDYFHRSAVATAQVLAGYDEDAIRARLEAQVIGVAVGHEAARRKEGAALLEFAVRMLARTYPRLAITGPDDACQRAGDLARQINPLVEIDESRADVGIALGPDAQGVPRTHVGVGSSGWDAVISSRSSAPIGRTDNPFGAAAAAAVGCANVFRLVFLGSGDQLIDDDAVFSTLDLRPKRTAKSVAMRTYGGDAVLVGLGAIGNGAAWALARSPFAGRLHLVDDEAVELSNMQRYVLLTRSDEGRHKVDVAADYFRDSVDVERHSQRWSAFVEDHGHRSERVLVAVDSAQARREVQASLPRWIANAWTQPGDLGVSIHPWDDTGACLSCLYLPRGPGSSEDKLIAQALGLGAERELQIRQLLHSNASPPAEFLEEVSERLGAPLDVVLGFSGRPLRDLYVEGVCGGAVISLDRVGQPHADVHVPLAHQSALAGVLLSAQFAAAELGRPTSSTTTTRIDVMRPLAPLPTQPARKDPRGICICQDPTYQTAYRAKYNDRTD